MRLATHQLRQGSLATNSRALKGRCALVSPPAVNQSHAHTASIQQRAQQQHTSQHEKPQEAVHPQSQSTIQPVQQQQQQHHRGPEVPSLLELLSNHGARLTTAAQMVWAQVLQPGDVAVDATCGNGHDSLFMAQCIGHTGRLHAVDVQASAIKCTDRLLSSSLQPDQLPQVVLSEGCHSQLQSFVGSNVASVVAFNLGYLPGGDKSLITRTDTTLAAVEAALEVVRPGGVISVMAYIGHPGGLQEYEAVKGLMEGLPPTYWTSSELRLINRPSAPVLLLLWRRPDAAAAAAAGGGGASRGR